MTRSHRKRLLVVGFGFRGRAWARHAGRHPRITLAGLVDPAPAAEQAAADLGLPYWKELADAITAARPDRAIISSPPDCHSPQATQLLSAEIPILVEKPVALRVEDVAALVEESERSTTPALAAHNFRFRSRERKIRRELASQHIGQLRSGVVSSVRPASAPAWTGYPSGRATLWDYAIHHIDALCVRMGGAPSSVMATTYERPGGEPWVTLVARLRWDREGVEIDYRHVDGPDIYYHREWLEGTNGGLAVDEDRVVRVSLAHRPRRVLDAPHRPAERHLLDGLLDAGPQTLGSMHIRTAIPTIATLEAMDVALDSGAEIGVAKA